MSGAWAATTGDSAWAAHQRTARVESTTLILKGGPIFDPARVAANPSYYLLDIYEHEEQAAALWRSRRRRNRYRSEGEIRLRYRGAELLPFGAVDDVMALWCCLVNLIKPFLDSLLEEAQRFFAWGERHLAVPAMDRDIVELRERLPEESGGWQL